MAIVFMHASQLAALRAFLQIGEYRVGLFKNDVRPSPGDSMQRYQEADFSGYQGTVAIENWTEPTMVDGRAFSRADTVTFLHDGLEVENLIFGYFVIDEDGVLMWAERNPAGPRVVSAQARDYVVEPVASETTEF